MVGGFFRHVVANAEVAPKAAPSRATGSGPQLWPNCSISADHSDQISRVSSTAVLHQHEVRGRIDQDTPDREVR